MISRFNKNSSSRCARSIGALLLFFNLTTANALPHRPRPIIIKVLLDEFSKKTAFSIKAKNKLAIRMGWNKKSPTINLPRNHFQVVFNDKGLFGRNRKRAFRKIKNDEIHFKSRREPIEVNGKQYAGIISLQYNSSNKKLYLINKLNLEDYVYSVLRAESYQTWPHRMQKIQAIISRTYAVRQMMTKRKNRKNKDPYDIKRTNFHQRYTGSHNFHHLRQAVNETRGLVLTHNKEIVLAMFDACCGGTIPANMKGIEFSKAPYLARKKPCNFCKNYCLYRWKRTIPTKNFVDYLMKNKSVAKQIPRHKNLSQIRVLDRDKAGVVHKISLSFCNKKCTISGNDLWMSMKNRVRSQNFSLRKDRNNVVITGRGFGHQVGLCQRGARELVRQKWPIKRILAFYYPQTTLSRLKT